MVEVSRHYNRYIQLGVEKRALDQVPVDLSTAPKSTFPPGPVTSYSDPKSCPVGPPCFQFSTPVSRNVFYIHPLPDSDSPE